MVMDVTHTLNKLEPCEELYLPQNHNPHPRPQSLLVLFQSWKMQSSEVG